MSGSSDITDWLVLSMVPGLGPVGALHLLKRCGSPGRVLALQARDLAGISSLRASQREGFARIDQLRETAADQLRQIRDLGAVPIAYDDDLYPLLLREIPDPPLIFYALGDTGCLQRPAVAVVGSRSATSYGRRAAHMLGRQLADHAVTVVSGLALGIDSEAHNGALHGGGSTIGVLGCGLDVVYPPQNRQLYADIRQHGLLLSEYSPGTRPEGFRFPARNRIIAGLSLGVVVVEAAKRSGSLITAQLALDFGREVFAVPGQIDSVKSEGAHWLLRQGARLVAGGEDIVDELRLQVDAAERARKPEERPMPLLDPDAVSLLAILEPYPLTRDEISLRSGLPPARLSELFLYLELEGCIEIVPGDQVRRVTT